MKFLKGQPNPGFKPGQSGNPSGRPPTVTHVRDLMRQYTEEAVLIVVDLMRSQHESMRLAAAKAILERGWGKPVESLDASITVVRDEMAGLTLEQRAQGLMAAMDDQAREIIFDDDGGPPIVITSHDYAMLE